MFVLISISCGLVLVLFLQSYLRMLHNHHRKIKIANGKDNNKIVEYSQAPGPLPWPIVGNLALLANYEIPFVGFHTLSKVFGSAFSLTLGSTRVLVVNNIELIREVLNQNGKFFGGRPDFIRYHKIFGGDRNNSLALCDWSQLQQQRRFLARRYCSPRESSKFFAQMSDIGQLVSGEFLDKLESTMIAGQAFDIKPLIQRACANMFMQYMCSQRFDYDDLEFHTIVEYFDTVFWEINQGYAVDFLPFLAPFYKGYLDRLAMWSKTVRTFILNRIINPRKLKKPAENNSDRNIDFTEMLQSQLEGCPDDVILFMLEDFIGGHSAIGNLVMLALTYIAKNPEVGKRIQDEVDAVLDYDEQIGFKNIPDMPYTMSTLFETLRFSSSPIVPHVATEDAVIAGFGVSKGTVVFLNNYNLNTSPEYWNEPEKFQPERFLISKSATSVNKGMTKEKLTTLKRRKSEGSDSGVEFDTKNQISNAMLNSSMNDVKEGSGDQNGKEHDNEHETEYEGVERKWMIKKNIPHFLPFSIGKRTCVGQNLVRGFGFILLANIVNKYNISLDNEKNVKIYPACVALPAKTFPLVLRPREY